MIPCPQDRAMTPLRGCRVLVVSTAFALALIVPSTTGWAATPGGQRWSMPFGPGYIVNIEAIAMSSDVVVALGFVQGLTADTRDRRVIAYDAGTGAVDWSDTFDASGETDNAEDVVMGPSGKRVFVTGESYVSRRRGYDIVTTAFAAGTGTRLWTRLYDGPHGEFDAARGIDIDGGGLRARLRHAVWPHIAPTLGSTALALGILYLTLITLILVLTGGGPLGSTATWSFEVFSSAFRSVDLSPSSVISVVVLGVNLLLGYLYTRLTGRVSG